MRKSKLITWREREVLCKELTVEEITLIMNSPAELTVPDALFPDRIPVAAVLLSTGLAAADLEPCAPSELDTLWAEVEEQNPFFARMLARLAERGRALASAL